MGRRHEAELYEDEYQEEERTRAAVSSIPSYDDQFEDRTRSARESQIALEGLARSGAQPRVQRRSFVDAEELLETPHRPSFVAASEKRSRVERPAPPPPPPTPRPGSRHSFVASSERADFASSLPDAEEITSHRAPRQSSHPVSQRPVSARRASQHSAPAKEERDQPIDYKALKSYLFDDAPASSAQAAAMSAEDRSVSMQTPVATLAPRMTNKGFRPAMHSIPPSMREPRPEVAPLAKISHHAFRPQAHSQLAGAVAPVSVASAPHLAQMGHMPTTPVPVQPMPSVAPSARSSHIAFRPPMMTGPMLPPAMPTPMAMQPMQAPVSNDSYVDSSWIVPTPMYASNAPSAIRETGAFKVTLSFVAAAITAVAALAVMIGAILFIRTEDAQPASGSVAATPVAEAPVPAPVPVVKAEAPVAVPQVTTPAAPVTSAKAETPKKKKVVAAQPKPAETDDADDAPPPPPKKKTAEKSEKPAKNADKSADKNVERMLAELGEQQLKNADK